MVTNGITIISCEMYTRTKPEPTRSSIKRYQWDEETFFREVEIIFQNKQQVEAMRKLYDFSKEIFGEESICWGRGGRIGSFKVRLPIVFGHKDIYSVDTKGYIWISFANIYGNSDEIDNIVDEFAEKLYSNNFLTVRVNQNNYSRKRKKSIQQ